MKTKFQWMTLCLIVLVLGVTACKKDGAIVPQVTGTDSTQNQADITNLPGGPK